MPLKSQLKAIVLKKISHEPISGYLIMKGIETDTNGYKPSTGSIYPLLESMLIDNLVTVSKDGRRKLYKITQKGIEELHLLMQDKEAALDAMLKHMRVCENIFGQENTKLSKKIKAVLDTATKQLEAIGKND